MQTLLHMLIQKADSGCSGTLSPPGIYAPAWDELVKQWNTVLAPVHSSVELGPEVVSVGRDDCEADDYITGESKDARSHNFWWDNENPCRQVEIGRFRVDFRPTTIKEFCEFWVGGVNERVLNVLPTNWVKDDGKIKVCVVRLSRFAKRIMGCVGLHGVRPGGDENCRELASGWIVRRVVGVR